MDMGPIKESLTFDDVMLMPRYSDVLPSEVSTTTKLEKNLKLKIPLMSSAMDTVTESKMAIEIGKLGGIGIIHRNISIKKQIQKIIFPVRFLQVLALKKKVLRPASYLARLGQAGLDRPVTGYP